MHGRTESLRFESDELRRVALPLLEESNITRDHVQGHTNGTTGIRGK